MEHEQEGGIALPSPVVASLANVFLLVSDGNLVVTQSILIKLLRFAVPILIAVEVFADNLFPFVALFLAREGILGPFGRNGCVSKGQSDHASVNG